MLTTSRGITQWGQSFVDTVAAVVLDRLLHGGALALIDGDNCRLHTRRARIEAL